MGKPWMRLVAALSISVNLLSLVSLSESTESPQYSVIHSESDFEIRVYRDSVWMSSPVNDLSFHQATKFGFHRLFQYIQGANLNFSRIPMTKPVLTSIAAGAVPLHSPTYVVHFYLPVKFQDTPPLPLLELKLKPVSWPSHCIAVRKFSGFARDGNVVKEAEKLATSLGRSPWANLTCADSKYAYSIAQYDSPFRLIGRVNEVWFDIDGSESNNCQPNRIATY